MWLLLYMFTWNFCSYCECVNCYIFTWNSGQLLSMWLLHIHVELWVVAVSAVIVTYWSGITGSCWKCDYCYIFTWNYWQLLSMWLLLHIHVELRAVAVKLAICTYSCGITGCTCCWLCGYCYIFKWNWVQLLSMWLLLLVNNIFNEYVVYS